MSFGRPTVYDPSFCERVIECGKEGMGRAEIAAELDVSRNSLANWEKEYPDFLRAMTWAKDLSLAWWMKQGKLGIWDQDETVIDEEAGTKTHIRKRLNANAYSLQVRNRFPEDMRDRQEHTGADGGPIKSVSIVGNMKDLEGKSAEELAAMYRDMVRGDSD